MEAILEALAPYGFPALAFGIACGLLIYNMRRNNEERTETNDRFAKTQKEIAGNFTDSQKIMVENFTGALDKNTGALDRLADGMERQLETQTRMTEVLHEIKGSMSREG